MKAAFGVGQPPSEATLAQVACLCELVPEKCDTYQQAVDDHMYSLLQQAHLQEIGKLLQSGRQLPDARSTP